MEDEMRKARRISKRVHEYIQDISAKARRKEITRKTKMYVCGEY
jgi:hypothetical protein